MLFACLALAADVSFNGSVASREQLTTPSEDSLVSTRDTPIVESLNELNLKGKATLFEGKLTFSEDVSAFVPFGFAYADAKSFHGPLVGVDEHDAVLPFIALSEYFAQAEPVEHVVLTLGKKRTSWGPGFAYSPTDLFNPPRDPTDPSLQRAGFLHAQIDVPFERFTVTGIFAPQVLATEQSIPTQVLGDDDKNLHFAAVLRGYALVADTDINAWVIYSNRYGDDLENETRFAATFSKNIFGAHEVHAEVLLQQGSARLYANPDCAGSTQKLALCAFTHADIVQEKLKDSDRILPEILVGWRYMPEDGSMVSLEYLYQADGYTRTELGDFERLAATATTVKRATPSGGDNGASSFLPGAGSASTGESPNRVSFQPRRRHYVFFSYTKPQVLDDFTISASAIVPVEDLSSLVSASVAWQAQEWLQLSLFGAVPLPSPARASADLDSDPWQHFYDGVDREWRGFVPRGGVVGGLPIGEYDGVPFRALAMLEARAFF